MDYLNAHLDLYFQSLKDQFKPSKHQQSQNMLSANGQRLGMNLYQNADMNDFEMENQGNLDINFALSDYLLQTANQQVHLDYKSTKDKIPKVLSSIVNFYNESQLLEKARELLPPQTQILIQQEYQTWSLFKNMIIADTAFKTFQNPQEDSNPRTLQQLKTMQSHKNSSHTQNIKSNVMLGGANSLNNSQDSTDVSGYEDFDSEDKIKSRAYIDGEMRLLKNIFQHLRCGHLNELQTKLKYNNRLDHLMLLNGALPQFDNVCYAQYDDAQEIFTKDLEEQTNIQDMYSVFQNNLNSTVIGNRNLLSFVNQFYQMKKFCSQIPQEQLKTLENGILGIQTGDKESIVKALNLLKDHDKNSQKVVNEVYLQQKRQQDYIDYLWANFKAISQSMLVNHIIQAHQEDSDDLDLFESFYTEIIDENSFQNLSQEVGKNYQFQSLVSIFKDALNSSKKQEPNWFEELQFRIVQASYQSSDQQRIGVTQWDDILDYLHNELRKIEQSRELVRFDNDQHQQNGTMPSDNTLLQRELQDLEQQIKQRFITHLTIMLAVTGRLTRQENRVAQYNKIVGSYIRYLRELTDFENRFECLIFYISFLLGPEAQNELYFECFKYVQDTNHKKQLHYLNDQYFDQDLSQRFLKYIAEGLIYENDYQKRENFLSSENENVRENIQMQVLNFDQQDQGKADVINWLFQEEDFKNAFYYQNELARKLLVDGRVDQAKSVLENRNETKQRQKLQSLSNQIDNPIRQQAVQDDKYVIVYLRERRNLIQLVDILQLGQQYQSRQRNERVSITQAQYESLLDNCENLLFHLSGSILLEDDEKGELPGIEQDTERQRGLEKVNKRYCIELLKIMFTCLQNLNLEDKCLTFIADLRKRNEKVFEFLSVDDLQSLIRLVTDVMMKSQSIMYEMLRAGNEDL
eukprot:403347430